MAALKAKPGKQKKPSPGKAGETDETLNKGLTWDDIKHFKPREFTCKCDGLCDHPVVISLDLVAKLDKIRDEIGRPISISSGTRCQRHNNKVGGKPLSAHMPKNDISHGVDVKCSDSSLRFALLAAALPLFKRIGISRNFMHLDDDPELPGNVIWVY